MACDCHVHVVWSVHGPESVHATRESAEAAAKLSNNASSITVMLLTGGVVKVDAPANPKGSKKRNGIKNEEEDDAKLPAKNTKTAAQQRADNANKVGKPANVDLPKNVKSLLERGGKVFEGQTVVVTGVPPTLGRKNTEKLVEAFGAHLGKSLSKKTGYVVIGNEAGPKKLEQIEELGLKTLDEDELIALLENAVGKRLTNDLDDDDEQPKITRTKRQKR